MTEPAKRRMLLKLSGEALMGQRSHGIDRTVVRRVAGEVAEVLASGIELAIVVGGGNIIRGAQIAEKGGDRVTGDHMGMLATVINGLALRDVFLSEGIDTVLMSGMPMPTICDTFTQRQAVAHLEAGRVVIFVGGTGNPFFTTDTGAALRAAEMNVDVLLKGTKVDGVYSADPKKDPSALRYDRISAGEALEKGLGVMDAAALALARENSIPIIVFSINDAGAFPAVTRGDGRGTLVTHE